MLRKEVFHTNIWIAGKVLMKHHYLKEKILTGVSYKQTKRIWNDFKIKNPAEYHDLYVQSDTLLLAICLKTFEIYGLDPAHYFLYPV